MKSLSRCQLSSMKKGYLPNMKYLNCGQKGQEKARNSSSKSVFCAPDTSPDCLSLITVVFTYLYFCYCKLYLWYSIPLHNCLEPDFKLNNIPLESICLLLYIPCNAGIEYLCTSWYSKMLEWSICLPVNYSKNSEWSIYVQLIYSKF